MEMVTMARGGARNRSGPPSDPNSARSDARGYSLTALPSHGFEGAAPDFPLPDPSERELTVWAEAWATPQACAWAMPSESWRQRTVALWVRTSVRCEDAEAGAALLGQVHRFADQIGMTTAGLAEMGWKISVDEVTEKRDAKAAEAEVEPPKRERRLRAVSGDQ